MLGYGEAPDQEQAKHMTQALVDQSCPQGGIVLLPRRMYPGPSCYSPEFWWEPVKWLGLRPS